MTRLQEQRRRRPPTDEAVREAMERAADRVREWVDRRLDRDARDIAALYRANRERLVTRLRNIYDRYLEDEPTLVRARQTGAGPELNAAVEDTVNDLADEVARTSVTRVGELLGVQPEVLRRNMRTFIDYPFGQVPEWTHNVLGELTTTVIGGGTFMDRLAHMSDTFKSDLRSGIRQSLINGDTFSDVRKRVETLFGVPTLPEPKHAAYGPVKIYRNEARRQFNKLMDQQARRAGAIRVWWAILEGAEAETTTPGCAARHGHTIEELGEYPPIHYNCRCTLAVFPAETDLHAYQEAGEAFLRRLGYSRRQAMAEESEKPSVLPVRYREVLRAAVGRGVIEVLPGARGGIVLAAPHGTTDDGTGELVRQLASALGLPAVVTKGYGAAETGNRRINVNRPTEGVYHEDELENEEPTDRAAEVYASYVRAVQRAAGGGRPALYIEIHNNIEAQSQDAIEVATVGVKPEEARALKMAWPGPADIRMEPVDRLRWHAESAKVQGIFALTPLALQIELPLDVSLDAEDGGDALADLREWLGDVLSLLLRAREADFEPARHPRDPRGRFSSTGGTAVEPAPAGEIVRTDDVEEALQALAAGKHVELQQPRQVATMLNRLAEIAKDAEARGERAPLYNLCNVSLKGTNLFCAEAKGVPRAEMPQLYGRPAPGSLADRLPRDETGHVDLGPDFVSSLRSQGIAVEAGNEDAAYLRATQDQLNGAKTALLMGKFRAGTPMRPIVVSQDNYILDGHHNWAATVGLEFEDGKAIRMPIQRVNLPIIPLLAMAKRFAAEQGLPQRGLEAVREAEFRAEEHPRDATGKFTSAGGEPPAAHERLVPPGDPASAAGEHASGGYEAIVKAAAQQLPANSPIAGLMPGFDLLWNQSTLSPAGVLMRAAAGEVWGGRAYSSSGVSLSTDEAMRHVAESERWGAGSTVGFPITRENADRALTDTETFCKVQYAATQKQLEDAHIDHLTLYRGVMTEDQPGSKYWKEGQQVQVNLASLSSFSEDFRQAQYLGTSVLKMDVPREYVFSNYKTGLGLKEEREHLVIGDRRTFPATVEWSLHDQPQQPRTEAAAGPIQLDAGPTASDWLRHARRRRLGEADFRPEEHPRGLGGKFIPKGAAPPAAGAPEPEDTPRPTGPHATGGVEEAPAVAARPPTQEELDYLDELSRDPYVIERREELARTPASWQVHAAPGSSPEDHVYTPERQREHDEIVQRLLNPDAAAPEGERTLSLIIGPPASGKTELIRKRIPGLARATVINADDAQEKLSDYRGQVAAAFHEEGADIAERELLTAAVAAGHNLVYDAVGKSPTKMLEVVQHFREMDYQVDLYHNQLAPALAARSALARAHDTGRYIDPDYIIRQVGNKPDVTYDILKRSGLLRSWTSYDAARSWESIKAGHGSIVRERGGRAAEAEPPAGRRALRRGRGRDAEDAPQAPSWTAREALTPRSALGETYRPPVVSVLVLAVEKDQSVWAIQKRGQRFRWELPGGHVEAGEDPEAAAVREMAEETGVPVEIEQQLGYLYKPPGIAITVYLAVRVGEPGPRRDPDKEIERAARIPASSLAPDQQDLIRRLLPFYDYAET